MSRPPRDRDPESYRIITIRTCESRIWLFPSRKQEKLILGIVARYQEIYGIEIFAYCFLGNHYHLLVRAPRGNIDEFEQHLNIEIARRINWKYDRIGKFWARPYSDQKVIELEDLEIAFGYVTLNPIRHGLVRDISDWGLLSSYTQSIDERPREYSFFMYSEPEETRVKKHTLRLTPIPQYANLTAKERRAKVSELLKNRAAEMVEERLKKGEGFLGIDIIREQVPGFIPLKTARSPRPACYTKCHNKYQEFKRSQAIRISRYREASLRYRLGDYQVKFPEHSFKPPLHRKSRLTRFNPLPDDFFKKAA